MKREKKDLLQTPTDAEPNLKEAVLSRAETGALQERLRLIIQRVSGKPNLKVTTEVDYQTLIELAKKGQDARRQWYRFRQRDKQTGKLAEYVHVPEEIFEVTENVAKGKAAHEAGHVVITRHGEIVPDEVMQELGFHAVMAAAEERPTDQVVRERYAGAGEWVDEARKIDARKGAAFLNERGGDTSHVPLFGQLADMCVYAPHYDELPPYDPQTLQVYESIKDDVEALELTLPVEGATEAEIIEKATERYRIYYSKIWPAVKKLVVEDKKREALNQMLKDALKPKEGAESKEGDEGGEAGGSSVGSRSVERDSPGNNRKMEELLDSLPPEARDELQSLLEELKKMAGQNTGGKSGVGKEAEKDGGKPKENAGQNKTDGEGIGKEISNGGEEGGDEVNSSAKPASLGIDVGSKPAPQEVKPQNQNTVPKKMSPALEEALQKAFDALPNEKKEFLTYLAKRTLEQIEDELVKKFSGQLEETPPETHEEFEARKNKEAKERKAEQLRDEEKKAIAGELKEIERAQAELGESKNPYENTYQAVRALDEVLYRKLQDVFTPNIKRKMRLNDSGSEINLPAVFRWEADKGGGAGAIDNRIFESVYLPEKKDYVFTLLNDLSGSMAQGGKIEEDFKAKVLLTEVLNRLGVKIEVLGFHDELISFKGFHEELSDATRGKMARMLKIDNSKTTNTGAALIGASKNLDKQNGKEKFLLILTDGQPFSNTKGVRVMAEETHRAVANILQNTNQKLIGVGVGPGTKFVKFFFPTSLNVGVEEMVEVLGNLLHDMIVNPEKYSYHKN